MTGPAAQGGTLEQQESRAGAREPARGAAMPVDGSTIRFRLVQPAQPKYRVPVFRELASRPGIDFELVYAEEPGLPNAEAEGYRARFSPQRRVRVGGQVLLWHGAQVREVSRRRADVVGMTWNTRYLSLVPALRLARLRGVGTVLWGHGFSKNESSRRLRVRVAVGRMATAVVLYNHGAAERVIAAGLERERVFVALNALDQGPIQAAREAWLREPGKVEAFRRAQGLEGRPIVLFVSRLEAANRVDLLLEAVARLRARLPGTTAVIVGAGGEEARLRRRAADLDLGDHARFVGPIYDEMSLAGWMTSADAFCYPANVGLSLLHAFGYGLPVVTGDNLATHNPEIEALRDGVNGLLFRDGDAGSLAEALGRVLTDRGLAASMREEARRTVLERFTVRRMVDGLEAAVRYAARAARAR
jgi:glycosyltransferase involved in cell wall biosynthesis